MRLNFSGGRTAQKPAEPKKMAIRPMAWTCVRTVRPTASNGLFILNSKGVSQRAREATDSLVELHTLPELSIISYRSLIEVLVRI